MSRFINQINVSITTNRTCNLRCNHCYIQPELFKDKTRITREDFMLIFDRVQDLLDMDHNLQEVEWEFIGGETTMMPFEFWEEMLPWSLARIEQFNKQLRVPGSMNFLSNLMFGDDRYVDLMNQYATNPLFNLYTSWEPDTGRFGRNDKLLPRFKETMSRLKVEHLTMDVILTKGVMEYGAKRILEEFVPLGVTDISCKMLSPYGSGKAFFKPNMASFGEMSSFLLDMKKYKPAHVSFTPDEEMKGSLHAGTSFQCNGNFYYDLTVEPNGTTSFNASQTGDEAAIGVAPIHLSDPLWAQKVCFYNTEEADNKLSIKHEECKTCDYLQFCNAGWYHYKLLPEGDIKQYNAEDCSGMKALWDVVKQDLGKTVDIKHRNHVLSFQNSLKIRQSANYRHLVEADYSIKELLQESKGDRARITITKYKRYSKSLDERLWFYDALRWAVSIDDTLLEHCETIADHVLRGEYHMQMLTDDQVLRFIDTYQDSQLSIKVNHIAAIINSYSANQEADTTETQLYLADDNLIKWIWRHLDHFKATGKISKQDQDYLQETAQYVMGD